MVNSRLWLTGITVVAVFLSDPGRVSAQDRATAATRDDAVLMVDGIVREVFQSARRDRVDFIVQLDVKRSESVRTARTPVRVIVPAPGDVVYVHISQRADNALGLGQTGGVQNQAPARGARPIPVERAQVRAYLYPGSRGGWEGAGNDWFELTSKELADANPTDPTSPAIERAPPESGPRPVPGPGVARDAKVVLTALGLTGEAMTAQGKFAVRVSSVEPGSSAQRAGLEPGDIILGVNDKALAGIEQLDQITQQGGRLNLVLLDVNTGKPARVPIDLRVAGRLGTPGGLPEVGEKPDTPAAPKDSNNPTPTAPGRSLGVSAEPVTIGQRTGMKVVSVQPGSPGQKAGIEPGDVIVAANGVPITGPEALSAIVHKSGTTLTLTVRDTRNGKDTRVDVTLDGPREENPAPPPADPIPSKTGRRLGALTEIVFHDVDPAAKVTEVDPGGPADRAGIEPGDVIVEANGTPILHPKNLDEVVRQSGPTLKLMVVDPRTRQKTAVEVKLGSDQ